MYSLYKKKSFWGIKKVTAAVFSALIVFQGISFALTSFANAAGITTNLNSLSPSTTGFYCYNDQTNTASGTITGHCEISANGGHGDGYSVKLTSDNSTDSQMWTVATNQFAGEKLLNSQLAYDTARISGTTSDQSIYPNININFKVPGFTGGWQNRVYQVPTTISTGSNNWVSVNAAASSAQWAWSGFGNNGNKWPDGTTTETLSSDEMLTKFPNMSVADGVLGQVLLRASTTTSPYSGYIDDIKVSSPSNGTNTFSFTAPAPEISKLEAKYLNNPDLLSGTAPVGYIGVSVESGFKNVIDATNYTVKVHRASGGDIVKQATVSLLTSNINLLHTSTISTPFVIEQGNYNEYKSSSWEYAPGSAPAVWNKDTKPTSVELCIGFTDTTRNVCTTTTIISEDTANWTDVTPGPVYRSDTNGNAEEYFDNIQDANDDGDGKVNGYTHTLGNVPANYGSTVSGDTIVLTDDIQGPTNQTTITKTLTINGSNHTVFGNFDKVDGSNNSVLSVQANGVRINELTVDGQNHQLHGINTYGAQDLQMWRVNLKNNGFSGLNVNRSWVQGVDLHTENNGWHGVDIDNPGAIFQSAGMNQHNETLSHNNKPVPALYVDSLSVGQVNDTNNQYSYINNYWNNGDRAYFLKSSIPAVPTFAMKDVNSIAINNGDYTKVKNYTVQLSDAGSVDHYKLKFWNVNSSTMNSESSAWVPDGDWSGHMNHDTGLYTDLFTLGDGVYHLKFAACTAADLCSEYTNDFTVTYDSTAPLTPAGLDWKDSANVSKTVTNDVNGVASWNASTSTDAASYIYKYWNDIPVNQYKEATPYSAPLNGLTLGGSFNQGEGVHHFCVVAVDGAGNQSPCSAPFMVTYDSTAPALTMNVLVSSTDTTPTVTGTVNDPLATIAVSIDGGVAQGATNNGSTWSFTPSAGLTVGDHTFVASATDPAGNVTSPEPSRTYKVTPTGVVDGAFTDRETESKTDGTPDNSGGNGGGSAGRRFARTVVVDNGVLGATTEDEEVVSPNGDVASSAPQVRAASDVKNLESELGDVKEGCSKLLGVCWYWWLIPVAVVVLFIVYRIFKSDEE